jgi:hypothetical protein
MRCAMMVAVVSMESTRGRSDPAQFALVVHEEKTWFGSVGRCQRRPVRCTMTVVVVVTECMCTTLNLAQFAWTARETAREEKNVCGRRALSEAPDAVHRDGGGRGDGMHVHHAQSGAV